MNSDTPDKNIKKEQQIKGFKSIRLPFEEKDYDIMLDNKKMFKSQINNFIQKYPDLFPAEIKHGYWLDGFCDNSIKQNIRIRRLKMKQNKDVYLIFPSFVMPYMTEKTDVADNILFLSKFPVPNWALAYVFKLDEKHTNHNGDKSYIAVTAAKGCFLGATVSEKADETELTKAYQIFKKEALARIIHKFQKIQLSSV